MSIKNSKSILCPIKKTSIGGQALIEGIMMKGPKKTSMAVRNPEGEMVIETWDTDSTSKPKVYRMPFLRGVFGFVDSMKSGYKCLMRSAEIAGIDDADTDNKQKTKPGQKNNDEENFGCVTNGKNITLNSEKMPVSDVGEENAKKEDKSIKPWMMNMIMIIASVLGVVLAIVLFKGLPEFLYEFILLKLIPALKKEGYVYSLLRGVFVGVLRIAILVIYMLLVSLMKDIKRTFMYHGAEHKSIMCYEKGLELTVENVRMQKRFHPRCGTSFLILMLIVGVFISIFIPTELHSNSILNATFRTLISLALLPVMMSLGYELIKLAGKHDNWFTKVISAPGIWLQHITTKEPEDSMIECAIVALKNVIPDDGSDDWNKK